MGNCKTVCLDKLVSRKDINVDNLSKDDTTISVNASAKSSVISEPILKFEKYSKAVINATGNLLSVQFYSNYLTGKNIEECIRIIIQDLSCKELFFLDEYIYDAIQCLKDYGDSSQDIFKMIKYCFRKLLIDIEDIIQQSEDNFSNLKIFFLSVIINFVEIYHYLRMRHSGKKILKRIFLQRKSLEK